MRETETEIDGKKGSQIESNKIEHSFYRKGVEQAKYRLGERMKDVNFWKGELIAEIKVLRYS